MGLVWRDQKALSQRQVGVPGPQRWPAMTCVLLQALWLRRLRMQLDSLYGKADASTHSYACWMAHTLVSHSLCEPGFSEGWAQLYLLRCRALDPPLIVEFLTFRGLLLYLAPINIIAPVIRTPVNHGMQLPRLLPLSLRRHS